MDKLVGIITSTPGRGTQDDDFADRLSSRYTVVMLVVFAILVGMNQYVRNPITCWSPVHFTGSHTKFSTSYCWVKNTYYLPFNEDLKNTDAGDRVQQIQYYQWVPFILLGQAIMFYIPSLLWHGMNSKAGVDADNILEAASTFSNVQRLDTRDKTLHMLINQIDRFLVSRETINKCSCDVRTFTSFYCCRFCGTRFGNYLILIFLITKLLYISNVIGQLFLLNIVLDTKFSTFGLDIAKNLVDDRDWTEDSYVAFPRVTMCDFKVRGQDMYNVHRYTLQCVLPINLYNEKIYIFLWFWMIFIAIVSIVNFFVWLLRSLVYRDRRMFIKNHLKQGNRTITPYRLVPFVRDYLKQDGAFLMRLIAHNTNTITTTEVICALWDFWLEKEEKYKDEKPNLSNSDEVNVFDETDE